MRRVSDMNGWLGGDKILQISINLTCKDYNVTGMNIRSDDIALIDQLEKVINIVVDNNAVDEFAEVEVE